MINSLPVWQLISTPAGTLGSGSNASQGSDGNISFEGLLGGLIGEAVPLETTAGQSNPLSSSSLTSNLPAITGCANQQPQILSILQPASAMPSSISGPSAEILSFLNQFSDGTLVPLNVIFDLEKLTGDELKALGAPSFLKGAALFARVGDLEALAQNSAQNAGEINIPVLAILNTGENGQDFSVLDATLTLKPGTDSQALSELKGKGEAVSLNKSLSSAGDFILNFDIPAVNKTFVQNQKGMESEKSSPEKYLDSLSQAVKILSTLIAFMGRKSSLDPASQKENSVGENINQEYVNTAFGNLGILPEDRNLLDLVVSSYTGTGKNLEESQEGTDLLSAVPGTSLPLEMDSVDGEEILDTNLPASATLLVLSAIFITRIEQSFQTGDQEKAGGVLNLLANLTSLKDMPVKDQAESVNSLLKELKALYLSTDSSMASQGGEMKSGDAAISLTSPELMNKETLSLSDAPGSVLKSGIASFLPVNDNRGSGQGSEQSQNGESASLPRALDENLVLAAIKKLADMAEKLEREAGKGNESVVPAKQAMQSASGQDKQVEILSTAASRLAEFIQAIVAVGKAEEKPVDSVKNELANNESHKATGEYLKDVAGIMAQALPLQDNSTGVQEPVSGVFSNVPGSQSGNSPQKTMGDIISGAAGDSKPSAGPESINGAAAPQNVDSNADDSENKPGGTYPDRENQKTARETRGGNEITKLRTSETDGLTVRLEKITEAQLVKNEPHNIAIPVKLNVRTGNKHSGEIKSRQQATVEYIKQSGKSFSAPDLAAKAPESDIVSTRSGTDSSIDELLATALGDGPALDDFRSGLERSGSAGRVETVSQTLRQEAASLRQAAGQETHTQMERTLTLANQKEVFDKISAIARLNQQGGSSEISLKLEPDHLGMMRVRITVNDNQAVNARIQVESHEARSLIENTLQQLKDSLAEQGLKVEKFSVDVRQNQNQEQGQQYSAASGRDSSQRFKGEPSFSYENSFENPESVVEGVETAARVHSGKFSYSSLEWVA